jgi:hypothetical protein
MTAVPPAVGMAWALLACAGVGVVRAVRERDRLLWMFAALALFFGATMFGPEPKWLGAAIRLPAPYELMARVLPFYEQARMPMRLSALATLALGVLSASALARTARAAPHGRRLLLAAAFGLLAFESLRVPLAAEPVVVPGAFYAVQAEPGAAALIDWPPGTGETAEIEGLHQTVHQQRLVQHLPLFLPRAARETRATASGADLRRLQRALFGRNRLARAVGEEREQAIAMTRERMGRLDVRFVTVRRRDVSPAVWERSRANLRALGPTRTFDDGESFLAAFD